MSAAEAAPAKSIIATINRTVFFILLSPGVPLIHNRSYYKADCRVNSLLLSGVTGIAIGFCFFISVTCFTEVVTPLHPFCFNFTWSFFVTFFAFSLYLLLMHFVGESDVTFLVGQND